MTISRKFSIIHIHPVLFFFLFVAIITGMLLEFTIIFGIVLFHEWGHFACARFFRWRIRRIFLWIFGGVMETDEYGSRPMHEECLVTIAGPIQHLWIYLFIYMADGTSFLSESTLQLIQQYNTFILVWNLLPIWPLDGGKLMQLGLERLFTLTFAHKLTIILSFLTIVLVTYGMFRFYSFSLSLLLLILFLGWENRLEWKRVYYRWWQSLWQRYSRTEQSAKQRVLEVSFHTPLLQVFRRFKRHHHSQLKVLGQTGDVHYLSERECLRYFFDEQQIHATIGAVFTE